MEAAQARRWRVPYEWILGSMFVASFVPPKWRWEIGARVLWLLVLMPLACRAFGVRREPEDPPPRFGLLVPLASFGWVYIAAWFVVLRCQHSMSQEMLGTTIEFLRGAWPVPVVLGVACLAAAAARPRRYRELGVFLNAAQLLVLAWGFDL